MKKSQFTEHQIFGVLKELETDIPVAELTRKYGISNATIYNWHAKYGGMTESDLKQLRHLEDENRRLKRMYADLSLDHAILKDVIEKKL